LALGAELAISQKPNILINHPHPATKSFISPAPWTSSCLYQLLPCKHSYSISL